jgi:hypothetical protein
MDKKSFNSPDEVRTPSAKTKIDVVKTSGGELHHATFQPGWKWSVDIKPVAGTDTCQVHHLLYAISGQLKTVLADGTEIDTVPGDIVDIHPGHDAWVTGEEPFEVIDMGGLK